ncbi:MAG: hypothetical protein ABR559_08105 [Gemmatimonadota bacterium]
MIVALLVWPAAAAAQDPRPLAPVFEPTGPGESEPADQADVTRGEIPLPTAADRTAAAARASLPVGAVLPASWTALAVGYQPLWMEIGSARGFGLERWGGYFAATGLVPVISPHPFFSPWGMLSYDTWLFERYRAVWTPAREAPLFGPAAAWLQRGDRAMIDGDPAGAAEAYRRAALGAPEVPLAYLGLGAALAAAGDDAAAARAFRQSLDRYPAWLALAIDWPALFGDGARLAAVQAAAVERARSGDPSSRFVAGVLHLFGGAPATGRELLAGLAADPHTELLLARGPR